MTPPETTFADTRRAIIRKIEADLARERAAADALIANVVPAVRAAVRDVRARGECGDAWLFGSYAWGKPSERSDVDLLLRDAVDIFGIVGEISAALGLDVHVVPFEDAPETLRARALADGIAL